MKTPLLRRNPFWLALSLVLMLVSGFVASAVQTDAGGVDIEDMRWETASGQMLRALLFKPDAATVDNKAPAIVVSHGWWNNREMQDANYVELARRGYVVVSIDMYGHGNSSYLLNEELTLGGTGMYDTVKLVADFPYVDQNKIGVSGHSNGARAANFSVALDNEADTQLIDAVFLVDNDPTYTDADGAYTNVYGSRDVGLVADQYDEFFFRGYDETGAVVSLPRDYITSPNAQSFLNFGTDPAEGETRNADQFYSEDGAVRIIYNPAQTHPWGTISKATVADQLEYWDEVFGTPTTIAPGSQIWQWKEAFTALGLVGFGIFLVAFTRALLGTRAFAGLKSELPKTIAANTRKGLAWFWGGLAATVLFSGLSYVWLSQQPIMQGIAYNITPTIFTQGAVFFIAAWAAINGIFAAIIMTISYFAFGKKNGVNLRDVGVLPGWKKFWHGIGLGAVVVTAAFAIVFVMDYFFKTDFRFWVLAVKAFEADKLWIALLYVPFFLVYFIANSVAVNGFNRFTMRGKEWVNTLLLAVANSFAPIVLVVAQYTTFFISGELIPGFGGIFSIWLFPVIVILAASAVISRKIYRVTNNPYIGGFINAAAVTIISVSNTLTVIYS
ncbi:pimeloyl-ACP methyl ester carboxylesterase [Microbacterium halimionae]|uniref:Pimeloyl-ACP methyl ester carboxylesterase n=1 Tax=Microbacterium halimionae TaxID=1526413 RepID=A0A7W3JQM2_9MICO|nr:prolyl oligopeptidase family serine peptidase [Microbacterium halimionae]MBA8817209.1 pimeloyl-ACP methyl ester carboxylesterase [Microbacterium halimionae]NII94659.1 pimeloyl-ACP methyl ester carboxylesterase [Microbacterium halimionae]